MSEGQRWGAFECATLSRVSNAYGERFNGDFKMTEFYFRKY